MNCDCGHSDVMHYWAIEFRYGVPQEKRLIVCRMESCRCFRDEGGDSGERG